MSTKFTLRNIIGFGSTSIYEWTPLVKTKNDCTDFDELLVEKRD